MSILKLFGGGKATKNPQLNVEQALGGLRNTLEMLDKREKHLQDKIEKELSIAKTNASKNQSGKLDLLWSRLF
jgi:charged multivesicular body protein 4A/B